LKSQAKTGKSVKNRLKNGKISLFEQALYISLEFQFKSPARL